MPAALQPLSRREFVRQIAYEYVCFEREHPGAKITPLDRRFAFSVGRSYCESGRYVTRTFGGYRYLDWGRVAGEARKVLPGVRRNVEEFGEG